MHMIGKALALIVGFASVATAQAATDVYLMSITRDGNSLRLGAPVNISAHAGYDNQPSFSATGTTVFFSSVREGGQSDIYRYEIRERTLARMTGGPESEYSPLMTPDRQHISVVRVERDSSQRLWRFPLAGGGAPSLVLEQVRGVGYHAWLNDSLLALFVLGSPNSLQLASTRSGSARTVASSIGRSLHAVPGTALVSYVDKTAAQWSVASLDPATGETKKLVATSGRAEDLAWLDGNTILCSNGTQLLVSRRASGTEPFSDWEVAADLAPLGLRGANRLAVSPAGDMLALVAAEPSGQQARR